MAKPRRTNPSSKWTWLSIAVVVFALLAYLIFRPGRPPKIAAFHQLTHDGEAKLGAFALGVPAPLVSDGSRLYFEEVVGSEVIPAEVAASGGETVPIQTGLQKPLVLTDLSPDRSELLLKNFFEDSLDGALFTMSVPGGTPRPLGKLTAHDAAWSPDGTRICYVHGNQVYVGNAGGTESKSIASLPGEPSWPRWSPDGARIRLTVQDAKGTTSLWEVSSSGENLHAVLPNWDDHPPACCGSWSPGGKYFVFQATQFVGASKEAFAFRQC
jgi:WD40 repeat protein